MCGLFCAISNSIKIDSEVIHRGTDLVAHRGPDACGFHLDGPVGLGHRRLAVIDVDSQSNQPMAYGSHIIIFNGVIYNYLELKRELENEGYKFDTSSDTEVLVASYDFWGQDCVKHFHGMWSFVIYDQKQASLFCSRDRFGIKPLYYVELRSGFYLASEIKQFRAIPDWEAIPNDKIVQDYLQYGLTDHTDHTFFKDVYKLTPGCNLTFDIGSRDFIIEPHYTLDIYPHNTNLTWDDSISRVTSLLKSSVRKRQRSDVTLGISLSGGLDSSCMTALAVSLSPSLVVPTISIAYPDDPHIDETKFIDAMTSRYKVDAHNLTPTFEEVIAELPATVWSQDEPIPSLSIVTQFLLFKKARTIGCKVMLDGLGADEIFCGYDQFYQPYLKEHPSEWASILIHLFRYHRGFFKEYIYRFKNKLKKNKSTSKESPSKKKRWSPVQENSRSLLYNMGIQALLRFEDRNAMAHGVESRIPYLDHDLVEFALSIPSKYKIKNGIRKYIIREAFKSKLPNKIYHRHTKLGYNIPDSKWKRRFLADIKYTSSLGLAKEDLPDPNSKPPIYFRALLYKLWYNQFIKDSTDFSRRASK